jgi:superfamily II DNA or RNA helicase
MGIKDFKQFQKETIKWFSEKTRGHGEWLLLKSPTGTGKTYIGLGILNELYKKNKDSVPVFLTFKIIGKEQVAKKLTDLLRANLVSEDFARKVKIEVINSYCLQEITGKQIVVVDEAHHLSADAQYAQKLKNKKNINTLIGMTGTPRKTYATDGFKEIFRIGREDTGINFPKIKFEEIEFYDEEFKDLRIDTHLKSTDTVEELCEVLEKKNNRSFYKFIAKMIYKKRKKIKKALIFIPRIEEAETFTKILNEDYFKDTVAFQVCGDNPKDLPNIITVFSDPAGPIKFLVGDKIIEEAFDEPLIDTLIFTKETSSDIKYSQMIGRAIRECKGKSEVVVIDFRNNVEKYHGKVSAQDYLFKGSGYGARYNRFKSGDNNLKVTPYKVRLDIDQKNELFNLLRDQMEYFGFINPKGEFANDRSFLTKSQVYQFLELFCFNLSENAHIVHEYFSRRNPTIGEMQSVLSDVTCAPLEVPLVRHIVKPLIEFAFNVETVVKIEETLPSGKRVDLMVCNNPGIIFEFGIEETDIKLSQILEYQAELKENGKFFEQLIIVGCSYHGESDSRVIGESIHFYNWKDFFIKILKAEELIKIVSSNDTREIA